MTMVHPGLPLAWAATTFALMIIASTWMLRTAKLNGVPAQRSASLGSRRLSDLVRRAPPLLFGMKLVMVLAFVFIIISGLTGSPIARHNAATVLTWNLWWAGLIFSIFFLGSAWCAVCPWNAIAHWLVHRRLWMRASGLGSLGLRCPHWMNNSWPALLMLVALTWLELGFGLAEDPYATAVVALLMVFMATASTALFERKEFCRNICPVGRTVGAYSQLSMLELRPLQSDVCARCTTLECYHGSVDVDPCPTGLVMGRLQQNNHCISCGNCIRSCPEENVAWRLRSPAVEALHGARPRWDEAFFMVGLLALTSFHGITMLPEWEGWISTLARFLSDSGRLLSSFTAALLLWLALMCGLYALGVVLTRACASHVGSFRRWFSAMAFLTLPLAFSYHLAHNLNHLVRESGTGLSVILDPLGRNALSLTMQEQHLQMMNTWMSADVLHALQALLMLAGSLVAARVVRYRGAAMTPAPQASGANLRLAPMLSIVVVITGLHLWMLMQPMVMRM